MTGHADNSRNLDAINTLLETAFSKASYVNGNEYRGIVRLSRVCR